MFKRLKNIFKSKKGFTLIELVIAMGVLGVFLAGVSIFFANNLSSYQTATVKLKMAEVSEVIAGEIKKNVQFAQNIVMRDEVSRVGDADKFNDQTNVEFTYIMLGDPVKYPSMSMTKGFIYSAGGRNENYPATMVIQEEKYGGYKISVLEFSLMDSINLNLIQVRFVLSSKNGKYNYTKITNIAMKNFVPNMVDVDLNKDGAPDVDASGNKLKTNDSLYVGFGPCISCGTTDHKMGETSIVAVDDKGNVINGADGLPTYVTRFPTHTIDSAGTHILKSFCTIKDTAPVKLLSKADFLTKYNCIGILAN